jgi:hypothetical protein
MTKLWWYVVAITTVLGAYLAWRVFKDRDVAELPDITTELEAIEAKAETKKLIVKLGEAKALEEVEKKHKEALDAMDEKKKAEAERLRADPGELARFLVRAGRPSKG